MTIPHETRKIKFLDFIFAMPYYNGHYRPRRGFLIKKPKV